MLRSVAAVAGGFASMAVLVMLGTFALVAAFVPGGMAMMRDPARMAEQRPTPRYLALNLTLSFIAAIVGGIVTSRIAAYAPGGHLIALGAVVLLMGLVSAKGAKRGGQPGWYTLVIPLVGVAGVAASALV